MATGYATLKSHVLRRDEKAFAGLTMSRFISAMLIMGAAYAISKGIVGNLGSIVAGAVVGGAFLFLTNQKGGMPRYMRIYCDWRARLMVAAMRSEGGMAVELCRMFQLDYEHTVRLDGTLLFPRRDLNSQDEYADNPFRGWRFSSTASQDHSFKVVAPPVVSVIRQDNRSSDGRTTPVSLVSTSEQKAS